VTVVTCSVFCVSPVLCGRLARGFSKTNHLAPEVKQILVKLLKKQNSDGKDKKLKSLELESIASG